MNNNLKKKKFSKNEINNRKVEIRGRNSNKLKSWDFRKNFSQNLIINNKTLNINKIKKNLNLFNKLSKKRNSIYINENYKINKNFDILMNINIKKKYNNYKNINKSFSFKKLVKYKNKKESLKKNLNYSKNSCKTKKFNKLRKEIIDKKIINSNTYLQNSSKKKLDIKKIYKNLKSKKISITNVKKNKIYSQKVIKKYKEKILIKTNNSIIKLIKNNNIIYGLSLDKILLEYDFNNDKINNYKIIKNKPIGLFKKNKNLFISQTNGIVSIFDENYKLKEDLKISKNFISHFFINKSNILYSISDDKLFNTYDLDKNILINWKKHNNIFTNFYYNENLNCIYLGDYFGNINIYDARNKFIYSKGDSMKWDYKIKYIKNNKNYLYIWDNNNTIKTFDIRNNKEIFSNNFIEDINNMKYHKNNLFICNNSIINLDDNLNKNSYLIKNHNKIYDFVFINNFIVFGGFDCTLKIN